MPSENDATPEWALRARAGWRYTGVQRPPFAVAPGPGEESVWDYPRPPRIEADPREVIVRLGTVEIARTRGALRVLETASPPTYYLPWSDVARALFIASPGSSRCEWKGEAQYWTLAADGQRLEQVAWSYPAPLKEFAAIADHVAVYPAHLACFVDGVRVAPQPGGFYGGWVLPGLVGPFKGASGSQGW